MRSLYSKASLSFASVLFFHLDLFLFSVVVGFTVYILYGMQITNKTREGRGR